MERSNSMVLLVWFIVLLINGFEVDGGGGGGLVANVKMQLIHRHSPELGANTGTTLGDPKNAKERMKQLMHSDGARLDMISQRLGRKPNDPELMAKLDQLVEVPMRSAADLGRGAYFVSIKVGTPAKKYMLLVDTGSVLTWIICKYQCRDCWNDRLLRKERVFLANESSSFTPIPCSTSFCRQDLMNSHCSELCPHPQAPCHFDSSYLDGTRTTGYFGKEAIKVRLGGGRRIRLDNMNIGCAESVSNSNMFTQIDGLLGLGFQTQSFSVKAAQQFGDKFSYCLADHLSHVDQFNFLIFGGVDESDKQAQNMQYTDLITSDIVAYYFIYVTGISVNNKMLDIPPDVWVFDETTRNGGVILDSGSSISHLVRPVYDQVISALLPFLSEFKKASLKDHPGEHCFLKEGFNETLIPKLTIHLNGGAKFEPPSKSYVFNASPTMKCIGFFPLQWPGISIIGNIMQQNHLWEFDFAQHKLGFAPSSCTFE